jgi:hypothetical protein
MGLLFHFFCNRKRLNANKAHIDTIFNNNFLANTNFWKLIERRGNKSLRLGNSLGKIDEYN